MEKELFIRARQVDFEVVEQAAKEAAAEFEKNAGFAVETGIDTDSPLGADRHSQRHDRTDCSVGGVIILGHGGKIECDNTLEERLKLLESQSLPKIRASIFGYCLQDFYLTSRQSPSRKFFD